MKNILALLTLTSTVALAQSLPPPTYATNVALVQVVEICGTVTEPYYDTLITSFYQTNITTNGYWGPTDYGAPIQFIITNQPCGLSVIADEVFMTWSWNNSGSLDNTNVQTRSYATNWGIVQGSPQTTNIWFTPYYINPSLIYPVFWSLEANCVDTNSDPTIRLQWKQKDVYGSTGLTDPTWHTLRDSWDLLLTSSDGKFPGSEYYFRAYSTGHGTNGMVKEWYRYQDNLGYWH